MIPCTCGHSLQLLGFNRGWGFGKQESLGSGLSAHHKSMEMTDFSAVFFPQLSRVEFPEPRRTGSSLARSTRWGPEPCTSATRASSCSAASSPAPSACGTGSGATATSPPSARVSLCRRGLGHPFSRVFQLWHGQLCLTSVVFRTPGL